MRDFVGKERCAVKKVKVKRAGVGTKLLIIVLLVAAVTGLLSMRSKLAESQAQRDHLASQIQTQEEENAGLLDAILHADELEYIINYARSKGVLMWPDEIRFVDTSN